MLTVQKNKTGYSLHSGNNVSLASGGRAKLLCSDELEHGNVVSSLDDPSIDLMMVKTQENKTAVVIHNHSGHDISIVKGNKIAQLHPCCFVSE